MLIKKILVYIIPIIFFFSYSFVYSDSNITNPYKINGTEFNVSIEFYNYPLKLGEQFFDIQIFNNKSKKYFEGESKFYFNTPDKQKRYQVYALKLPESDSIYKAAYTFKKSGIWLVELELEENTQYEKFYFEMNIEEASVGSYEYGYLLMLSLPLLILVGVIMLSREARKNKR